MRESALKSSILLRLALIGAVAIVLTVPTLFVSLLISDRQATRAFAVREVTEKWGQAQTLVGPILTLPVTTQVRNKDGEAHTHTKLVRILPDHLNVTAKLIPEIRSRGIFRVVLYTVALSLQADFNAIAKTTRGMTNGEIRWNDASLTIGISDLKGIKEIKTAAWDNSPLSPEPGSRGTQMMQSALTLHPVVHGEKEQHRFLMEVLLRGSEEFRIVPAAGDTRLNAEASWSDPSFVGSFLPESREIKDASFSATWRILDFNRNLPQSWLGEEPNLMGSSFGVRLLLPIDEYQKAYRALKYAVLFIVLTFMSFFVLDVMRGIPFHPVQYLLIGFALVLFYVLLLSISEYVTFNLSYWIASLSIVLLIVFYTRGTTSRPATSAGIGACLLALYGFLFVLLQLEDYALLMGSIGLFLILALVMYLTRKIDWFGVEVPARNP